MTHAIHSCGILDDGKIIYGGEAAGYVVRFPDKRAAYCAGDTNVFTDMQIIERLYHPRARVSSHRRSVHDEPSRGRCSGVPYAELEAGDPSALRYLSPPLTGSTEAARRPAARPAQHAGLDA